MADYQPGDQVLMANLGPLFSHLRDVRGTVLSVHHQPETAIYVRWRGTDSVGARLDDTLVMDPSEIELVPDVPATRDAATVERWLADA